MKIARDSQPTAGVSCGGWERGLTVETEKTQSQKQAQKTRCLPTVSCTLCWAVGCGCPAHLYSLSLSLTNKRCHMI